jgi:hypothetical protein
VVGAINLHRGLAPPSCWSCRAHTELEQQTLDDQAEISVALNQARLATVALTRATAATADDPMLVPAEAANGLGHLLAVYLIAIAAAT